MKTIKLKESEILVLRNVKEDMTSYNGFKWKTKGHIIAEDWIDNYSCGNGLHGLPWGVGAISNFYNEPCRWLILKVDISKDYNYGKDDMIDKCKFKECDIVYCGERKGAIELIQKYAPVNMPINFVNQTAGDGSTQTAGDWSTQTARNGSTQTAGYESTQTAGYRSTQTAGYRSTQTARDGSTQTAGYESTQTAGYRSTQTAGNGSTQTAGDRSTQTAGDWSTQTARNGSTQTAGINSVQIIRYYDDGWRVKARVITKKEANKPYIFEDGDWRLIKKDETLL